jgi:hypothetical protein
MNNELNLTDDELACIITALAMTLKTFMIHESQGNELDYETQIAKKGMLSIYKKLDDEYFGMGNI